MPAHGWLRREVVGITAAVATLVGYTSGLFYGFSLRVLYSVLLFGLFTRNYSTHNSCLYIWGQLPVKLIIIQAIQSILWYAYITTIIVISSEVKHRSQASCLSAHALVGVKIADSQSPILD